MTSRIRKCVAAATLAVSLGGGGTLIAANATHMIASTADAGMPATLEDLKEGRCYSHFCPIND